MIDPDDRNADEALVAFARLVAERADWLDPEEVSTPAAASAAIEAAYDRRWDQAGVDADDVLGTVRETATRRDVESVEDLGRIFEDAVEPLRSAATDYHDVVLTAAFLLEVVGEPTATTAERRTAARLLHGAAPVVHDDDVVEGLVRGLADETVRPFLLGAIDPVSPGVPDRFVTSLVESDDPDDRLAALVYLSATKTAVPGSGDLAIDAIDAGGEAREYALRWLWDPAGIGPEHLDDLLALVDDADPTVRVAGLTAAAPLVWTGSVEDGREASERAPEIVGRLTRGALDPDVEVRRRAVGLVSEVEAWNAAILDALPFETRWRFATALAAALLDEDDLVAERAARRAAVLLWDAVDRDSGPTDAPVKWPYDDPTAQTAREAVAAVAADRPGAVAPYARVAADAVARGQATEADARILAAVHDWATAGDPSPVEPTELADLAETTATALADLAERDPVLFETVVDDGGT